MKKYLFLIALWLTFFVPGSAQATAKFLVLCSTACTWDNTNDAIWSLSSGGANNTTHPVAGDDVTLDAATCVGGTTCTITTGAVTISAATITWGACTASTTGCIIKADTNNTNFTLSATNGTNLNGNGSGTRKWIGGSGTYTITQNGPFGNFFALNTATNDQGSTFNSATWVLSGTAGSGSGRGFLGGTFSFGPTTFNANSGGGTVLMTGASTFASLTINGPNTFYFGNGNTQTITGALTLTGSSSSSVVNLSSNAIDATATLSLGAASTGTWVALHTIITSGAAGLTASNCFNLGLNTLANGGTCTGPSGGGGGGRIIGG